MHFNLFYVQKFYVASMKKARVSFFSFSSYWSSSTA